MLAADVKKFAQTTVKNETATPEEKKAARQAIRRINAQTALAQGRPKRPQRRDYDSDEAHYFALKEFRSILDKAAVVREASKILDDPESSVYMRRKARETLYGPNPEPTEPVKTVESQSPEKPPRSRLGANELAEEQARARAFLDALDDRSFDLPARPAPQSVTSKAPITPPTDTALFCEQCRVPFSVCGCDRVICNLCLRPQADCYPPCQNSRRR